MTGPGPARPEAAPAVLFEDVHLAYGTRPALAGLSLEVRRGEMFGLVGPDGAGKTTAIRTMLGLLVADRGAVRVLGLDPVRQARELKHEVGYLSQRFTLYGDLTVQENLDFQGEIHRVPDRRERMARLLDFTRLDPYRKRRADQLSGGMQKKLALAASLLHRPKVLFLDEPTTGVDPVSRREFWTLLHSLLADGLTVVLTTPYLDEAERCGRVALVRAGRTLALDEPLRLRESTGRAVLEIVCEPLRAARDLLAASPRVREVQLFGDRLHAVPAAAEDELADLVDALGAQGVRVAHRRPVMPALEDVFISLVRAEEARERAGAGP